LPIEQLESFGKGVVEWQRGVNWWIGDIARAARRLLGDDNYSQVFPPETSPGLIQRCEAVAKAYPKESDRNPLATWTQHMNVANKPNRIELVAAMVSEGQTSDESRKAKQDQRWLLAVDTNYFLHRFWFSGAGIESAVSVAGWIERTVERLREKGLTDVACCFDSRVNRRKELTAEWQDKYKDRPPKDPELSTQLNLVRELLEGCGFACVSVEGYEADDCMASFAAQFDGKVTVMTQDKDCRQCLSDKCNMLLDVEWAQDETSGENMPEYKWMSAKQHTEETGIPPNQWAQYQAIMGDNVDGIKGAVGIGQKGAADLIREFGSAQAVIQAARDEHESIRPKKREALIEFEDKLDVTLSLVSLVTDLPLPNSTRI
jgi:5'-3' exonuclease